MPPFRPLQNVATPIRHPLESAKELQRRTHEARRWRDAARAGSPPCPRHHSEPRIQSGVTYAIRYAHAEGELARPLLRLQLAALDGDESSTVAGVVDSGADESALPIGWADALGFRTGDLLRSKVRVAGGGVVRAYRALRPIRARVLVADVDQFEFELVPLFVPGTSDPLWGRRDFFAAFQVTIDDTAGEIGLTPMIHPRAAWAPDGPLFD